MLILVFQTNYTASFYLIILLPSPGLKKKIQRTVQKTLKGTKTLRRLLEALWKAFCLKLPTILFENVVFLKNHFNSLGQISQIGWIGQIYKPAKSQSFISQSFLESWILVVFSFLTIWFVTLKLKVRDMKIKLPRWKNKTCLNKNPEISKLIPTSRTLLGVAAKFALHLRSNTLILTITSITQYLSYLHRPNTLILQWQSYLGLHPIMITPLNNQRKNHQKYGP